MRDSREVEQADDVAFTDEEIARLAEVRDLPHFPVIRSALLRYQARAMETIQDFTTPVERIREAQGRCALAKQFLDLLEHDAPRLYEQRHPHDDDDDEP